MSRYYIQITKYPFDLVCVWEEEGGLIYVQYFFLVNLRQIFFPFSVHFLTFRRATANQRYFFSQIVFPEKQGRRNDTRKSFAYL